MARVNQGIRGWRRVTSANPCPFCAMLASRGGVYSADTMEFASHDHCSCSQEPVYAGEDDPPEVVRLREEWEQVTRGLSGEDAIREWNRYWDEVQSGARPRLVPTAPSAPRPAAVTGQSARDAAPVGLGREVPTLESARHRDERFALMQYRGQAYVNVNEALRRERGAPSWLRSGFPQIDDIDAVMARSPLARDVLVFRGVSQPRLMFGDAWDRNLTGAQWTEHAYVSTSTDRAIIGNFVGTDGVEMRIRVPRGTGAVELSGADYESELLLNRGLTMRVVSDTGPGSRPRVIEVEALP